MKITGDQLSQITSEVCESMLALSLSPTSGEEEYTPALVASVNITGAWNAVVEVAVCNSSANTIAETMFACDEPSDEEVIDAVGEIANMIGGNIKGLVGTDCNLSIPCVGQTLLDSKNDVCSAFELGSGRMHILLKHVHTANDDSDIPVEVAHTVNGN